MTLEARKCLYDVDHAVALIQRFTEGVTFEAYERDPMLRSAVERRFLFATCTRSALKLVRQCQEATHGTAVAGRDLDAQHTLHPLGKLRPPQAVGGMHVRDVAAQRTRFPVAADLFQCGEVRCLRQAGGEERVQRLGLSLRLREGVRVRDAVQFVRREKRHGGSNAMVGGDLVREGLREMARSVWGRSEYGVSALKVGSHARRAEVAKGVRECRHRQAVAAADVDSAKERHMHSGRLAPGEPSRDRGCAQSPHASLAILANSAMMRVWEP